MESQLIDQFEQVLLSLDRVGAEELVRQAMNELSPIHFVEKVVVPVMEKIGTGWEEGRVALSQVYMIGRVCEKLVDDMLPPEAPDRKNQPRIAIGVLDDYHLLGKRIVYTLLRAGGYELIDYGRITADEVIDRVSRDKIEMLLISVLMLPSALQIKTITSKLRYQNPNIKIVVGGAPFRFDGALWEEVGADAMGQTASDAMKIVAGFMEESK